MKKYIRARAAKLLEDLNNTPFTDDCEDIKLALMLAAMREVHIEMFRRSAENARSGVAKIEADAKAESIQEVEDRIREQEAETGFEPKVEHKIKLSSSILRRVDNN